MNQQELSLYLRCADISDRHDEAIQQYNHVAEETGNPNLPLQLPTPNKDILLLPFRLGSCQRTSTQIRERLAQSLLPIIRQQSLTLKFSQLGDSTKRVFLSDGSLLDMETRTPLRYIRNLVNNELYKLGCQMTCKKFQPLLNLYNREANLPENIRAVCTRLNEDNWSTIVSLTDVELVIY